MEENLLKKLLIAATTMVILTHSARAEDCDKKGSEIEKRACMAKEISGHYSRLDKLAEAKAKTAEAIGEPNTPKLRQKLRDAQKHWKQYTENYCDTFVLRDGGAAGADSKLFCKIDHIADREKELGK